MGLFSRRRELPLSLPVYNPDAAIEGHRRLILEIAEETPRSDKRWNQLTDRRTAITGEVYCQDALKRVGTGQRRAWLIPQPDNPYDKNAVGVWVSGERIGYLRKKDAARYSAALRRRKEPLECSVEIAREDDHNDSAGVLLAVLTEALPDPKDL